MRTDARPTPGRTYFPVELIPDIARRLTSLQDFFSLRAACRAYRDVLPPSRALLACQPPHLLVPQLIVPNSSPSLALFHLAHRRLLRFRAHLPYNCFNTDGARIFAQDDVTEELVISHLFTGEQVRIPHSRHISSHVLLAGDLVLHFIANGVRYCRLGDAIWSWAFTSNPFRIRDMRYVNGILYALSDQCQLAVAEILDGSLGLTLLGGEVDAQVNNAQREWMANFWLGECAGDLLLIFRELNVYNIPRFKVFRWELGEQKWVRMMSLGGNTLFMSDYHLDAWLGPDFPGIRGDCIYNTLSDVRGWTEYSLADGSCKRFTVNYQGAPESGWWRQGRRWARAAGATAQGPSKLGAHILTLS